jgi:phytanoyl-CoA dioxygenase PhyH
MSVTDQSWDVIHHATPEQVALYREQGYAKLGPIFSREELELLRTHVDEMIAALPPGKRPEAMDTPHFEDPWLFRYLAHPRLLDIVEDFIGPDIVLWSSHFIAKPSGDGKAVPWHTDGAYWGQRLQPMQVITFWLAVDPSRVENGCMRVIGGSHRRVASAMEEYEKVDTSSHVFGFRLPPHLIDESRVVDLELEMGECHVHDAWTIHGSNANVSPMRRCGYTMRYIPAHVVHTPARGHRIYLLRGQDRTGGRNCYAEFERA